MFQFPVPTERITELCLRWGIVEFSLFGSVLRNDFGPDSDVDVLVVFQDGRRPQVEAWMDLEDELQSLFGRSVDLVERRLLLNPFRRHEILTTRRVVYAA